MKKIILIFSLVFLFTSLVLAQAPLQMNFQAMARNAKGESLANQNIRVRISIHDNSASGLIVYSESRVAATNSAGIFNVVIGSPGASTSSGNLELVKWDSGDKFLQFEFDPEGNSNFIDLGTTQLQSVPYALNAHTAAPIGAAGGDLAGSYPKPYLANNAVTTAKIADFSVTDIKIESLSGSKVLGNISGNAANVTGVVAIANGGTGANNLAGIKSSFGLANVENTRDLDKPISTRTQIALASKLNAADTVAMLSAYAKADSDLKLEVKLAKAAIVANTAKVGITSEQADAIVANTAKVGITSEQADAIITNTAKVGITAEQADAIVANTAKVGITSEQADAIVANTAKVGITSAQADAIITNTSKVGITAEQADAIVANTAKVGITSEQANAIVANTAKVGITSEQADAIAANTAKVGITSEQANAIVANTAKVGITSEQADAIVANTAKIGITTEQADAIVANTAKVGITSEQADAIVANTAKVGITSEQADAIVANTAKVGITSEQADAIVANTAKVGITSEQADAIVANTAKVGITSEQADAIVANTVKVGITSEQADAIVANTAKVGITSEQADAIVANSAAIVLKAPIASPTFTGILTAPSIVKSGGTSSQYLMADGSVSTAPDAVREVADEFTATAAQTSFTLTHAPSANSKIKMYINGIRISNTAYSFLGTTLTYVPANNGAYALSVGDRIQFDYFY